MRLVSYASPDGPRAAIVRDGEIVDLHQNEPALPTDLGAVLAMGEDAWPFLKRVLERGKALAGTVRLTAPIPMPRKIICVGLNYADHAAETGATPPPEPVIFNKFPTAIIGPGETIHLPADSNEVDYEAELVVVIGRSGRRIPEQEARNYVAGYMCGNDVSARDWQLKKPGGQWLLGKSFDTFAPTGPHLLTKDEIENPHDLRIRLILNGNVMQDSRTSQFIFSIPRLIAYVSRVCTLEPGDLIFTGTPGGVGFTRNPPVFLKAGDVVEVEIEGIGRLTNPVAGHEPATSLRTAATPGGPL